MGETVVEARASGRGFVADVSSADDLEERRHLRLRDSLQARAAVAPTKQGVIIRFDTAIDAHEIEASGAWCEIAHFEHVTRSAVDAGASLVVTLYPAER